MGALLLGSARPHATPAFARLLPIGNSRPAAALEIPEVVLFATPMSVPTGERGKLLQRIHVQLAKLNNAELARAVKMLKALE
jgi:hypothetical protein